MGDKYITRGGVLKLSNPGQLELLRGMEARGVPLRTMVRGYSMRPVIEDRDIITITPLKDRQPRAGDIVAYNFTGTNRMAIHRVIAKKEQGWLIRGDNCQQADGILTGHSILGYVTCIERRGKVRRFGLGFERHLIAFLNRGKGLIVLKQALGVPRRAVRLIMRCLQGFRLYRALGKRLVPKIDIMVAQKEGLAANESFYPLKNNLQPDAHAFSMIACFRGKKLGRIDLVCHSDHHNPWAGCWIFSLNVLSPCRGLGIGEKLVCRAIGEAIKQGAGKISLTVFEKSHRAINLYQKLGFIKVEITALEPILSKDQEKHGSRRIVMEKKIEV